MSLEGVFGIINELKKINKILSLLDDHFTTAMPVVLILIASLTNLLLLYYIEQPPANDSFGRVILNPDGEEPIGNLASVQSIFAIDGDAFQKEENINFIIIDSSSVLNPNNPLSNVLPTRDGLLIYKVQKGDNVSKIAANFGISVNTIVWANPHLQVSLIVPGQEIVILPVTGVLHQVQSGETLDSIASQYSVDIKRILDYNPGIAQNFAAGSTIIIPDAGKPIPSQRLLTSVSQLPSFPGYFAIPTTGWNWGRLHNYNAVDIANACGTSIYASAEGLVIEVANSGWNDGYGNYVLIEHPNGTKTRYAHNLSNAVSIGDYILKGELVAYIGNTGNTHGPTGCHLHFEVMGAKNPFAK